MAGVVDAEGGAACCDCATDIFATATSKKSALFDRYELVNLNMSNPSSAYRQSQVLAASPVQLIHLAYEGAIGAIAEAQALVAPEHNPRRKAAITKAQLIIGELRRTLDFSVGGAIAVQLARLYDFMQSELRGAIFSTSGESLQTVKSLLTTLDEAWTELSATARPTSSAPVQHNWAESDQLSTAGASYCL